MSWKDRKMDGLGRSFRVAVFLFFFFFFFSFLAFFFFVCFFGQRCRGVCGNVAKKLCVRSCMHV